MAKTRTKCHTQSCPPHQTFNAPKTHLCLNSPPYSTLSHNPTNRQPWGDFDELQAFTGVLDELRVWETIRTDDEILTSFNSGMAAANASELNFYWRFDDDAVQGGRCSDSSGNNRHGTYGAVVTIENQLQFSTGRPSQVPAMPAQLPSTAAFVGSGPVVVSVVAGSNTVTLLSFDPDSDTLQTRITALPTNGVLTTLPGSALALGDVVTDSGRRENLRVLYTPSTFATWSSDWFTYSVNDGGGEVSATVELIRFQLPSPRNISWSIKEDELSYKALARAHVSSVRKVTQMTKVVITSLPQRGRLYQACFEGGSTYPSICTTASSTPRVAIDAPGTALSDSRGVFLYQPDPNEFGRSA